MKTVCVQLRRANSCEFMYERLHMLSLRGDFSTQLIISKDSLLWLVVSN